MRKKDRKAYPFILRIGGLYLGFVFWAKPLIRVAPIKIQILKRFFHIRIWRLSFEIQKSTREEGEPCLSIVC